MARTRDWRLSSDPGSAYAYSNANYWVAARLVERLSGQSFDDYLAQHVFEPLGMTNTENTTTSDTPVADLAEGHVTAYGGAFAAPEPMQMDSGAGGVVSTAHDMAQWLAMQQLDGRAPDGTRLLSASLVAQSHQPQPHAGRAGLGWMRSERTTPARVSHSGASTTFNAQQDLVPETGYAVVVMLNSFTPSREHAYELSSGIIDLTGGQRPDVGLPVPVLIDLTLGLLTLVALGLGAWGIRRAQRWSDRRREWAVWRFGLRLLPQMLAPTFAVFMFLVVPQLQDNSITTADVFRIFPALTVLLSVLAAVGLGVTSARLVRRIRPARSAGPEPVKGS